MKSQPAKNEILPCFACIPWQANVKNNTYKTNAINHELPHFGWKNEIHRPVANGDVKHLQLLDTYQIPFIFDIHAHFFSEHIFKAIWRWFDKVDWAIAYRYNESRRLGALADNKVKYFTTLMYAHKAGMAADLNRWVFDTHCHTPGAVLFGTFYPEEGVEKYVRQAVEEFGLRGFKLHCEVSRLDLSVTELQATFRFLEKQAIPLVIHTGTAPLPGLYTGIKYFEPFIKQFPDLKVIVAHMGAHEIESYATLLDHYPGLGLDTTMIFVDFLVTGEETDQYFYLLEKYKERIYFGSDFPNIPYDLSHPIMRLLASELSATSKRRILYQNACKLFDI